LIEAESGLKRTVDFGSKRVRDAYAQASVERDRSFRRWCATSGVVGVDLPTMSDPISPLIRFFADRGRRRSRP